MDAKDQQIINLQNQVKYLENIIALMPGHVYWLDANNVYLGCNDLQAAFLNFKSRYQIVGKTNQDLVSKELALTLDDVNRRVMETKEARVVEEQKKESNGVKTYLSQKVPLLGAQGEVVGLLGVSFDISDRKRMEKELIEAKEIAEISNQAKSDFIRNMEHDIRTPLSGILSVASYLFSLEQDPLKSELLGDLQNASQELIAYFNSILEVSRLTQGGVPIILKEFDLEDLVKSVFMLKLPAAKSKHLKFTLDYKKEVPKVVIGDSFRTYRILLNLVGNAIKYTEKGLVKICVELVRCDAGEVTVNFLIEDSGSGIKKQDREIIYNKFICGTSDSHKTNQGMGLGLWIVKQFLQDLGGEISLESELGKGSVFKCILSYKLPQDGSEKEGVL